jgi:hypothetical protein
MGIDQQVVGGADYSQHIVLTGTRLLQIGTETLSLEGLS